MTEVESKSSGSQVLIGLALDVSGSMKQSIQNDTSAQLSRLEGLSQSLTRFASDVRRLIQEETQAQVRKPLYLFAYGFGFKHFQTNICDLLALLKVMQQGNSHDITVAETQQTSSNGFAALGRVARRYRRENWVKWAEGFIDEDKARLLAQALEDDPDVARELAELLPHTIVGAGLSYTSGYASELLGFGFESSLDKAKKLALQLIGSQSGRSPEAVQQSLINQHKMDLEAKMKSIGEVTFALDEAVRLLDDRKVGNNEFLSHAMEFIYGDTPMCKALRTIQDRFQRELQARPQETQPILFVLSDGEATDGDPIPLSAAIKAAGISIISCFVTDQDITRPRVLFGESDDQWSKGARTMFEIASPSSADSLFAEFLKNRGWHVEEGAQFFAQVNHSKILEEFIGGFISLLDETDTAGLYRLPRGK